MIRKAVNCFPSSSVQYQIVPEAFGAGAVELGGISFMVLKKSTSCVGTSASTDFARASGGALQGNRTEAEL